MHDVVIPAKIVEAIRMSEDELLVEVAIYLYAQGRLTLEQASQLAQMHRLDFQKALADRNLEVHYSVDEFEEDIATLKSLGRL